eukprot:TRINITY_DN62022_c0_g1_i1.p1 TRINITY_DN62022_c0_g1~~TRINITY_DN62022_c0_g1_i1.p1  ORF type:complete len:125 (-),score=11.76 TRINITY_DN62022_c0_g1_i1:111-485(-)
MQREDMGAGGQQQATDNNFVPPKGQQGNLCGPLEQAKVQLPRDVPRRVAWGAIINPEWSGKKYSGLWHVGPFVGPEDGQVGELYMSPEGEFQFYIGQHVSDCFASLESLLHDKEPYRKNTVLGF